ncbi:TPA: LOW QUALITY PROTEIN: hypothetical protein N0F65_012177 [Lagenidium giganteum]|uniref:Endonuclease/exonuclease/phosphatase domain-containing protein n=1 Tax=Lagenidium giganteum TaxID=4803 RepID=A0AAV2ZIH1_9STRA|nr:TPA: LOW QUALITY PROTEIN: hypothetical protein N0F65_012177 [Lagenidium giganteum]
MRMSIIAHAVLVLSYLACVAVADSTTSVRVMSFNLRTTLAKDPCPSGCWDQRQARIRQLLQRYNPDLIGTQEDAPDQVAFFTDALGYASLGPCANNERNAIFYKRNDWNVLESSTFALSATPDQLPSNTWNLEYLRAAVWARFQHRATGRVVCMLNTHYDITRGQPESSVLVAERLGRHCHATDSVFMTGDLNTEPSSVAVQYLLNKAAIAGHNTPIPLYEALTVAGAGGPTWIGSSFGDQPTGGKIDYILSRQDNATCVQRGIVILDRFDGYSCSDHAVVQAEFCLGTACTQCKAA